MTHLDLDASHAEFTEMTHPRSKRFVVEMKIQCAAVGRNPWIDTSK